MDLHAVNTGEAWYLAGLCYKDGVAGVQENVWKAAIYFARAADMRFPGARDELNELAASLIPSDTHFTDINILAAERGSSYAYYDMASALIEGFYHQQNIPLAIAYLVRACELDGCVTFIADSIVSDFLLDVDEFAQYLACPPATIAQQLKTLVDAISSDKEAYQRLCEMRCSFNLRRYKRSLLKYN